MFLAIAQSIILSAITPPADPPAHILELVRYEGTGGDMSLRDPHECVALEAYQRTIHYWHWTFTYAY
jgi:hypothetical protein